MLEKKTLIMSLTVHMLLLALLIFGLPLKPAKNHIALEARLMFKKKARAENLLPQKMPQVANKQEKIEEKTELKKAPVPKEETVAAKAEAPKIAPKKKVDYKKELARLSQTFSEELSHSVSAKEDYVEIEADGSYFDQIYSLIKRSFVVPPHVNGPQGRSLQAVLRLFLSPEGNLSKLVLEHSSGDEHFDKAVMDGTKRVANFGPVPIMLQTALSKDGVMVEMCPFKCLERRGG